MYETHAGVGISTSSPGSHSARSAKYSAGLPPAVTTISSGA